MKLLGVLDMRRTCAYEKNSARCKYINQQLQTGFNAMHFASRCLLIVGLMRHHGVNGNAVVVWHEMYVCLFGFPVHL